MYKATLKKPSLNSLYASGNDPNSAQRGLLSKEFIDAISKFDINDKDKRKLPYVKKLLTNFWRTHLEKAAENNVDPAHVEGGLLINQKGEDAQVLGEDIYNKGQGSDQGHSGEVLMPHAQLGFNSPFVWNMHSHILHDDNPDYFRASNTDMNISTGRDFLTDPLGRFAQYGKKKGYISKEQLVPELSKLKPFKQAKAVDRR